MGQEMSRHKVILRRDADFVPAFGRWQVEAPPPNDSFSHGILSVDIDDARF